jgi:hypothetical protein
MSRRGTQENLANLISRNWINSRADELGFLNAFDRNHDLICAAAARIYVRGSRGSDDLVAANF